ncbi:MAG: hypothetical protein WA974_09930 [Thermodesulfobacteriota bacterium]
MMKKLGLLAFILGLVIAFAMPALAFTIEGAKGEKMYIGGTILTDIGAWSRSKELIAGVPGSTALSDRTEFYDNVLLHSVLHGTVEVGPAGMLWEFGMGENRNPSELLGANTSYVETRLLYGWYNFGNCQILAGKNHGQLYSVVPWQTMGVWQGHVYGFGWGSIYDQRNAQIRFTQNVTKQVGWQISLVDPDQYADAAASPANKNSYTYLPQVDAKVSLNFGMVALYPAFGYQYVKWDNVAPGFDDNVQSWFAVLPVVVKAAGFTGTIQAGYGQNTDAFLTFQSGFTKYGRDASGKVKNTTTLNGFVDLAYTFGPATPHLYFGYDNEKNSDIYGKLPNSDDNNTRMMYGASINYNVAGPFYIIPEFTYYDYGKSPILANKPDIGKEWIGGVQFRFVF